MKKKSIIIFLQMILISVCLTGCRKDDSNKPDQIRQPEISVQETQDAPSINEPEPEEQIEVKEGSETDNIDISEEAGQNRSEKKVVTAENIDDYDISLEEAREKNAIGDAVLDKIYEYEESYRKEHGINQSNLSDYLEDLLAYMEGLQLETVEGYSMGDTGLAIKIKDGVGTYFYEPSLSD